jgi:hypothetical protein
MPGITMKQTGGPFSTGLSGLFDVLKTVVASVVVPTQALKIGTYAFAIILFVASFSVGNFLVFTTAILGIMLLCAVLLNTMSVDKTSEPSMLELRSESDESR